MPTRNTVFLTLLLALFTYTLRGQTTAEQDSAIYKGLRLSLFDFHVREQSAKRLTLTCQAANTGRLFVSSSQREQLASTLLLEADYQTLPPTLQGREEALKRAVLKQKFNLAPGEIQPSLEIQVPIGRNAEVLKLRHAPKDPEKAEHSLCADLVFDTAYVAERTEKTLTVHFVVRNTGKATANLLGAGKSGEDNLAINAYFQRGERLTRGAIFAEGIFIQLGKETLDGLLRPGQQLHGDLTLPLKARTRFSPDVILELDPFQRVEECDRRNNTRFLFLVMSDE